MAGAGTSIAARTIWKKLGASVVVVVLAALVFLLWYRAHYSMEAAETLEFNPGRVEHSVLIATQGWWMVCSLTSVRWTRTSG
jgi:hypothetical protein